MFAWFAFSFMTKLGARMRAVRSSFPPTNLSTWMGFNVSFILWVLEFSAITVIFGHCFVVFKLALRATPREDDFTFVFVSVDVKNPSLDTFQVHRNVAARTSPNVISLANSFRAYDTVVLLKVAALLLHQFGLFVIFSFWFLIIFLLWGFLLLCVRFFLSFFLFFWSLFLLLFHILWFFTLFIRLRKLLVLAWIVWSFLTSFVNVLVSCFFFLLIRPFLFVHISRLLVYVRSVFFNIFFFHSLLHYQNQTIINWR